VEKPLTKTQALRAIFQRGSNFEWRTRDAYVHDPLAQRYFRELWKWRKVKDITIKERLFKWK
jgi:hypothetical protein